MDKNQTIIDRVVKMELYFDTIKQALDSRCPSIINEPPIKAMLNELVLYFNSGLWLSDYEADERGELPPDLKRGVLSQDALYNLLCEIGDEK